jgi:signal transduction histidine kinase
MPVFFVFAIAFTAFILDGVVLWSLIGIEAAVYAGCCLAAYRWPELITPMSGASEMWDSVYSLVAAGGTLAVAFHLLLHTYERERRELARMSQRLAESYEAKSRFLALAAHELNTPLALIQLQAEEGLAGVAPPDPSVHGRDGGPGDAGRDGAVARRGGVGGGRVGGGRVGCGLESDGSQPGDCDSPRGIMADGGWRYGNGSPGGGPRVGRNLEVIAAETARLGRLIGELLDLARIEDGRMAFEIKPESLGALIQDTLTAYGPLAAAAKATIGLGRDAPNPVVLADRGRIAQVLVNLLANAVRHTPGGSITVDVHLVGERAEISVTDTGEGMTAETLAGLFSTAPAVPRLGSERGAGLGLGLAISHHIVTHHGGQMRAESVLGRGTTVTFSLPLVVSELSGAASGRR